MAFAGFTPGEAEGLRRAMSRKRSAAAIEAHHERFVQGAARDPRRRPGDGRARLHDDRRLLGLRLPQGPRRRLRPARLPVDLAARALQARVHLRPAQRAADGLLPVGHADPRVPADGDRGAAARRQPLAGAVPRRGGRGAPASSGSASATSTARGRTRSRRSSPSARRAARTARWGSWPRAPGAGRPALSVLAWSGACDSLIGAPRPSSGRRQALWQLGVAAPAQRATEGDQLALPLELPDAPDLKPLEAWERMVADYATTGVTAGAHPMALVREDLPADVVHAGGPRAAAPRHAGADRRPGGRAPAARRPPTASSSCCSRTSTGRSTSSSRRPPTTATAWSSAASRWCSPRAGWRSTRRRRGRSTSWWTRSARWTRAASARPATSSRCWSPTPARRTRWPTPTPSSRGPRPRRRPARAAGLRRRRPAGAELRPGAATMTADLRIALPRERVGFRARMAVLVFVLFWVLVAIGLVVIGHPLGPRRRAAEGQHGPRRAARTGTSRSPSSLLGFGAGLPIAASLGRDSDCDSRARRPTSTS